jgi:hypothetical protein
LAGAAADKGRRIIMPQSLEAFLADRKADTETIQQATRVYLAQRTDYLPPEEMRRQLIESAGDESAVNELLREIENDPRLAENASLAFLSQAWAEPEEAERIQDAVDEAEEALPVVESIVLATVTMYGMYLVATGGVKKREKVTVRKPDGTLEERETKEYYGPGGPLSKLVSIFRIGQP